MGNDISATQLAQILDLSVARVGQLARDGIITRNPNRRYQASAITEYIHFLRNKKSSFDADGEALSREYLQAKTEYTKSQNIKLKRQLTLEAGKLLRAENLDRILTTFLRHFEAQTDWIKSNRTGDHELLEAHLSSVRGAAREIEAAKITEGFGIDET